MYGMKCFEHAIKLDRTSPYSRKLCSRRLFGLLLKLAQAESTYFLPTYTRTFVSSGMKSYISWVMPGCPSQCRHRLEWTGARPGKPHKNAEQVEVF